MSDADLIPAWEDGQLRPLDKLDVHRRGLRHLAISVFVTDGDAVLLQRRALGKYHTPGLWANTCCTHPHWGEPAEDCARRRLGEELGIVGVLPEWRSRVEYRADVGGGLIEHELVDIFLVRAARDLGLAPNPAEVMDTEWMGLAELARDTEARPERYTPWLRIYMRDHATGIFAAPVGA
ncbi:MAG TPA: isopentenyl-diphosphate delta-isomerase [Rhodobacteraceae bacterium]|jgi:isopentenyl-diphosphate delta-isomerase|nr:isopentenyl-diphosphate Delta-isomerase [Paracoccaceae bacterium]HBG99139.1 isopentenyl-diphosphate delta-isomerase [Paracoccaceae bacterium]